jgi:hypothetical protein
MRGTTSPVSFLLLNEFVQVHPHTPLVAYSVTLKEAVNPTYLLAWLPESLLHERGTTEWDKFVKIEEKAVLDEEDEGASSLQFTFVCTLLHKRFLDVVLIDLPTQRPESYAFSVPLTSIYSLIVHPPTLSSWCQFFWPSHMFYYLTLVGQTDGSIGINLINGETLPTLHFHDDESRSYNPPSPKLSRSNSSRNIAATYPPTPKAGISWGGEDLLTRLRSYAHILRSTLQPSLYLLDPSRTDIEAHTTQLFADDAVDDILAQSSYANSHSPIPAHRRPRPLSSPPVPHNPYSSRTSVLHRSLSPPSTIPSPTSSQARLALLQSFSNITRATRHAAQNILSHPLAKPIIPHLPDPVKSLVNADGEWEWGSWVEKGGVGEFESARVYLARWARIVAEEGERARRREAQSLPSLSSSGLAEETSSLGIFELLHSTTNLPTPKPSRDPAHPVDEKTWVQWFAEDGRPKIGIEEMKREIFMRGICPQGTIRKTIWPFVLGVHDWDITSEERAKRWEVKR